MQRRVLRTPFRTGASPTQILTTIAAHIACLADSIGPKLIGLELPNSALELSVLPCQCIGKSFARANSARGWIHNGDWRRKRFPTVASRFDCVIDKMPDWISRTGAYRRRLRRPETLLPAAIGVSGVHLLPPP